MIIEQLQDHHLNEVVALWNNELASSYPLRLQLLRQNVMQDPNFFQAGSWAVKEEQTGALIGFIVAKASGAGAGEFGLRTDAGWIHALFVAPHRREEGIGSTLLSRAVEAMKDAGIRRIALGNDLHRRLFPGIPDELTETKRWFERRGFGYRETAYDLMRSYEADELVDRPTMIGAVARVAEPGDREALEAFMNRCFPGTWDYQLRDYWAQGGTGREYLLLESYGKLIGFCRMNDAKSPLLAQNIYWAPLFEEELGGIGPLGIDEEYRSHKYGLAIVQTAIHTLQVRGIRRIVIDTTPFVDFYGKLGYEVWKTYAKYDQELE